MHETYTICVHEDAVESVVVNSIFVKSEILNLVVENYISLIQFLSHSIQIRE